MSSGKRVCLEQADQDAPVSRSELDKMFEDFGADTRSDAREANKISTVAIMEQVAKGNLEQEERITARVKGLVMQYDKGIQKQFKGHGRLAGEGKSGGEDARTG